MKTNGPGKYDSEATVVRVTTGARGVLLAVIGGERGTGFSVQGDVDIISKLPSILRLMATQIETDMKTDGLPIEEVGTKEKAHDKGNV